MNDFYISAEANLYNGLNDYDYCSRMNRCQGLAPKMLFIAFAYTNNCCYFRIASPPLLGFSTADNHDQSPIMLPKSMWRHYHLAEDQILSLGNGYKSGAEKMTYRLPSGASGGRNTFGTYDTLRPIFKLSFHVSTDSLPPPPSPRTLQRVMSAS